MAGGKGIFQFRGTADAEVPLEGKAMEAPKKTLLGFTVSRRCDNCGIKCTVAVDDGERCIIKCMQCGKEYSFRWKSS
jgi:hypothetical protein